MKAASCLPEDKQNDLRWRRPQRLKSIPTGHCVPFLQPLVELRTGAVTGYEVLVRWAHPNRGLLLPEQLVPRAEKEGWIGDLTGALLESTFAMAQRAAQPLHLSLNVSPLQLQDFSLPEQLVAAAAQWHFELGRLTIEVTESALLADRERALLVVHELKRIGCKLSLDDFGTGYSSLRTLQALPFDEIKIDRSFVASMLDRRESRKIVASVVGLGQSLGMTTVAEGVELQEQADLLLWLGCERGQGWLFGKPQPGEPAPPATAPGATAAAPFSRVYKPCRDSRLAATPAQRLSHLQAVYDGAPVALAFLDRTLRYRNLNQRLASLNGASVEAHIGRTVQEIRPDLFPSVRHYLERALANEAIHNVRFATLHPVTGQPQSLLLSYQPAVDEAGEVVGVSLAAFDLDAVG